MPNDRVPKHKERLATENEGLQKKVSQKQAPNDTDKAGLSDRQRENVATAGAQERESVSEYANKNEKKIKTKDKS